QESHAELGQSRGRPGPGSESAPRSTPRGIDVAQLCPLEQRIPIDENLEVVLLKEREDGSEVRGQVDLDHDLADRGPVLLPQAEQHVELRLLGVDLEKV